MKKEMQNKEKLLNLKRILDEFLNNDDCSNDFTHECEQCTDKKLCNSIYRLNARLGIKLLEEEFLMCGRYNKQPRKE